MEQDPQAPGAGTGNPGDGGVFPGAERGEWQDRDDRDGGRRGPVQEHPPPVAGQQHRDRVRRHDQQGQLVQVAADDQQHGVDQPATGGKARPARPLSLLRRGAGLGSQGMQQGQGGAEDAGEDECVGPGGLGVVADRRGQRDDQPGEQPRPSRPGQPPADDHGQGHAHDHADHRGNPHDRRAGANHHPAVHQQVVEPVDRVHVAEQAGQLVQAQQRGPAGGHLVVAHGRVPRQAPDPQPGHDQRGEGGGAVPRRRGLPARPGPGPAGPGQPAPAVRPGGRGGLASLSGRN